MDPAIRFFDSTAKDYDVKHYGQAVRSLMTVRQERVLELVDTLALPQGAKVLDAGCGPGYLVQALALRGFNVCGADAAAGMLRNAKARLSATPSTHAVEFELCSIEELPYPDESFDLVCSTGVIEYLQDDAKALSEMFRVLKPGGHLVLPVTNRLSPGLRCVSPVTNRLSLSAKRIGDRG